MDFHSEWQLGPARFHTPSMNRLEFTALRIAGKCRENFGIIEGCGSQVIAISPSFAFCHFTTLQTHKML
jgi:hypothetical protein